MIKLFHQTLPVMERAFVALEGPAPKPQLTSKAGEPCYRYIDQTIYHAIILKLVRVVSGLHAALLLLENGFVQEQAVYHRIIDELNEDIVFLVYGAVKGDITDLHTRYLKEFYEEEFDDSNNPITSPQKRGMIPRKKIRAYIAKIENKAMNPSDGVELSRTISKMYSGFVHAAAPHIMDMYGRSPPRFHLSGMLGTPLIETHTDDLLGLFFMSLLSFVFAAKAFGNQMLVDELNSDIKHFESVSGISYREDPRRKR